jgi:UPF0755 protein
MNRKARRTAVLVSALVGVLCLLALGFWSLFRPVSSDPSAGPRTVEIERGLSLRQIAERLRSARLIRSATAFEVAARLRGAEKKIKTGRYSLSPTLSPFEILSALQEGKSLKSCFTVPEGYTLSQVAALLEDKGLAHRERFARLASDRDFLRSLGIEAGSVEGYLYPETYCVQWGAPEEEILKTMVEQGKKVFDERDRLRAAEMGLSTHKILTLASIIEKETRTSSEKQLVSAVFHNRLKAGMPLQSDPTVIYALGAQYRGALTKQDLAFESPYNTYLHQGLPPGPICNPGFYSIKAALYPAETDYLYFVLSSDGRLRFSSSLDEHSLAVMEQRFSR